MKTCRVCSETKPYLHEFAGQPAKSGWNGLECYACKCARQKSVRATLEGRLASNAATIKHTQKPGNREKRYAAKNAWQSANPAKNAAYSMAYHAEKLRRTPPWVVDDIHLDQIEVVYIYAQALGMVVDHVVPLRGKLVSGLHVYENLQLLTAAENSAKGNTYAQI